MRYRVLAQLPLKKTHCHGRGFLNNHMSHHGEKGVAAVVGCKLITQHVKMVASACSSSLVLVAGWLKNIAHQVTMDQHCTASV